MTYDANAQRLCFNDGRFWVMGCQSAGDEPDAGTLYPTLIEDSNGNQITLTYAAGGGMNVLNSSARLITIQDGRPGAGSSSTFSFSYNSDATPHLTGLSNNIQSGDSFTFTYNPVTLGSPFGNASFLQSSTNNATNLTTQFTYDAANAGELTQVTFPLGGHLRWDYLSATYDQSTVREVAARYLQWDSTIGERTYTFFRTPGSPNQVPVASRDIHDNTGNAFKSWLFQTTAGAGFGLLIRYDEGTESSETTWRRTSYTWATDPAGNPYVSRSQALIDPGHSYAVIQQVDQTVDQYGNVTQTKLYDYSDLDNPAKTFNTAYLTPANGTDYAALYIRNRVASVTLTDKNGVTTTLRTNAYDQYPNGIAPTDNISQHDTQNYAPSTTTRGNLYDSAVPWASWHSNYDQTGRAVWTANDINPNHYVSVVTSGTTNYVVPDRITTSNALNTDMTWSAALDPMTQTGANGDLSTVQYDASDRPQTKTSPYGAQTTYAYSVSAPQIVATTNNRWVKTYLDGLGRPAKIERGDGGGTQPVTEMIYDACGCNPMGKLYQRSVPHAPGATARWAVYTYDGIGRRLTAVRPDGHSNTTYSYAGNTVTITDPSGKWKQFTRDAFGDIVQVQEPSPHPGSEPTHVTTYAYDVFGHLINVTMPRTVSGTVVTQTRTWSYDPQTLRLLSKTSPEAGTVTYTYNSDNTLATMTDAKNQRRVYSYDQWGRVIQIAGGTVVNGVFTEDTSQRTTYAYEGTNGGYSSATQGRVSQITYGGPHGLSFTEWYSYHKGGVVMTKRLHVSGTPLGSSSADLDAAYTYDNEGQMTSAQYPNAQVNGDGTTVASPKYNYSYDTMKRLNGMTDANNNALVSGVTYNAANQMLQLNAASFTETRVYNVNHSR